jgi:PKD repeat protein
VTDANGCSTLISKQISVKQIPDVQVRDLNNFSPFKNCDKNPTPDNPNYDITITNASPSAACIVSYTLDWGDGSAIVTNPTFPISHRYTRLGAFKIVITGISSNGCSNSKTYLAANQSNPDIGIATFGPTIGCAALPISTIITTWQSNSPGTTYELTFGDGAVMNFEHPLNSKLTNDTVYHTYNTSPCPTPAYQLKITATNGCKSKSFIGGDIEVRTKPQAGFSMPKTEYCVNQNVCFTNQSIAGNYVDCSTTTDFLWDFGDGTPNSSAANPCHTYKVPGTYVISLTASNPCGKGTVTKRFVSQEHRHLPSS